MDKSNDIGKGIRAAIVILGASGDLAKGKLIPALAKLHEQNEIDSSSVVIGSGRTDLSDESFRMRFNVHRDFLKLLYYHKGISGIKEYIQSFGTFNRVIFFMALPPSVYAQTAAELSQEGFGEEATLIIEKPFGYDFSSARELNTKIAQHFKETQIYRIDHYLAKEAVQNILVFRFANSLFYPVWNSNYIESIQINAFEEIGVEDRGAYFDSAGMIRDMAQNHLTQLICLITMEAPVSLDAEEIREQKLNILKALRVSECRRFQYKGYLEEKGVAAGSQTETYAEMKLFIDSFRWSGMPIYIRAGKALNRKGTEIGIRFKPLPKLLFNKKGNLPPNRIIFKIQPAAGIVVDLSSKLPGGELEVADTNLAFCYHRAFESEIPEAYQKLLLDSLNGDRTLFVSAEEMEMAWKKYEPVLDTGELGFYEKGTVPEVALTDDWIDFGKYGALCR